MGPAEGAPNTAAVRNQHSQCSPRSRSITWALRAGPGRLLPFQAQGQWHPRARMPTARWSLQLTRVGRGREERSGPETWVVAAVRNSLTRRPGTPWYLLPPRRWLQGGVGRHTPLRGPAPRTERPWEYPPLWAARRKPPSPLPREPGVRRRREPSAAVRTDNECMEVQEFELLFLYCN